MAFSLVYPRNLIWCVYDFKYSWHRVRCVTPQIPRAIPRIYNVFVKWSIRTEYRHPASGIIAGVDVCRACAVLYVGGQWLCTAVKQRSRTARLTPLQPAAASRWLARPLGGLQCAISRNWKRRRLVSLFIITTTTTTTTTMPPAAAAASRAGNTTTTALHCSLSVHTHSVTHTCNAAYTPSRRRHAELLPRHPTASWMLAANISSTASIVLPLVRPARWLATLHLSLSHTQRVRIQW